jgi:predicted DNA-binding transcriptional regulator AlpA
MQERNVGHDNQSQETVTMVETTTSVRMLRYRDVCKKIGVSRTTVWRLERSGGFPPRRQLSANVVGWVESEVDAWLVTRAAVGQRRS